MDFVWHCDHLVGKGCVCVCGGGRVCVCVWGGGRVCVCVGGGRWRRWAGYFASIWFVASVCRRLLALPLGGIDRLCSAVIGQLLYIGVALITHITHAPNMRKNFFFNKLALT